MRQVVVDGEDVIFGEAVPESPSHVYELLMEALSEQGRVVVDFSVDGHTAFPNDRFPDSFEKIEAKSVSHDELTLRLIIESMNQMSEMESQLDAYIKNILSIPWSEVFKRMDELINRIQPFAELIDNIGPYANAYESPWADKLKDISVEQAESSTACWMLSSKEIQRNSRTISPSGSFRSSSDQESFFPRKSYPTSKAGWIKHDREKNAPGQ